MFSFVICFIFYNSACNRNTDDISDTPQNQVSLADSAAILANRWQLVKDSSTNIGNYYFIDGGITEYPNPGVYTGAPSDYWDFRSDGTTILHANNNTYNTTYILYTNNKLMITGLMPHGMGNVIKLSQTEAILDWSNTSPNGGMYFRRSYLKK